MANKKAKKKAAARAAVAPADKTTMVVTLYDGTREPIEDQDFLIRIFDGFQNQLFDDFKPAPTTVFSLPFRDNLQDDADFQFQTWAALGRNDPVISSFISVGSTDADAETHYDNLRETKPAALASLLNLARAMKAIQLPNNTPLDYFKEILWDESLAQDRFFGYADKSIVDQVRRAAMEHEFAPEPNPASSIPMRRAASNRSNSARRMSSLRSTRRTPRRSTEWTASRSSRTSTTSRTSALTRCSRSFPTQSLTA